MIKVLHVISDTNIGGAGKMLLAFLKHVNKSEFCVAVVLPKGSLLLPQVTALGICCFEVEGIAEKSFQWGAVQSLRRLFAQENPDVVHTHATLSARLAAKMHGKCKVVYTRHSVFNQSFWRTHILAKWVQGGVNNLLSDRIVAVSPAAKQNLVDTGTSAKKISVIFNGVDALSPLGEEEKQQIKSQWGLLPEHFVLAMMVRLEAVKGVDFVLEAAAMLQKSHKNIRVLIAGTGTQEQALLQKATQLQLTNCKFLGFVQNIQQVAGVMDVQLNASFGTEATSISLLEGMSLCVPAVVSNFGGNPYVIEHGANGFVVPQKNAKAIYEAVVTLYNDKHLYKQMQQQAKKTFDSKFTVEVMTTQMENLYRGLQLV